MHMQKRDGNYKQKRILACGFSLTKNYKVDVVMCNTQVPLPLPNSLLYFHLYWNQWYAVTHAQKKTVNMEERVYIHFYEILNVSYTCLYLIYVIYMIYICDIDNSTYTLYTMHACIHHIP